MKQMRYHQRITKEVMRFRKSFGGVESIHRVLVVECRDQQVFVKLCLFDVFFVSCLEVFRSCASSLRNSMLSSVTAIEDDAIQGVSSNDDVSSDMKDIIWRENQHCWVFIIWNSCHVDLQRDQNGHLNIVHSMDDDHWHQSQVIWKRSNGDDPFQWKWKWKELRFVIQRMSIVDANDDTMTSWKWIKLIWWMLTNWRRFKLIGHHGDGREMNVMMLNIDWCHKFSDKENKVNRVILWWLSMWDELYIVQKREVVVIVHVKCDVDCKLHNQSRWSSRMKCSSDWQKQSIESHVVCLRYCDNTLKQMIFSINHSFCFFVFRFSPFFKNSTDS